MRTEDNVIIFDNDDEITNYFLSSSPVINSSEINGRTIYSYNYDFTPEYYDACNNGMMFKIDDPNSLVRKRKCVCRGVITKKISNICD